MIAMNADRAAEVSEACILDWEKWNACQNNYRSIGGFNGALAPDYISKNDTPNNKVSFL